MQQPADLMFLTSTLLMRAPATAITIAGEPEPGAVEPSIFSGTGVGAGAFLNISLDPELEQQIFY